MLPPFVEEFLHNPAAVGSLIPSSSHLTRAVVGPIDFATARCIVEYGPGTGVFTDVLISRRRAETVVLLVEVNERFCQQLQERYAAHPNVYVVHGSAEHTGDYLRERQAPPPDYVVCGLPFTSLPLRTDYRILQHTQELLRQSGGKLILFQYSRRNTELFERFFRPLAEDHVLLNLPPAHVFQYAPLPETTRMG